MSRPPTLVDILVVSGVAVSDCESMIDRESRKWTKLFYFISLAHSETSNHTAVQALPGIDISPCAKHHDTILIKWLHLTRSWIQNAILRVTNSLITGLQRNFVLKMYWTPKTRAALGVLSAKMLAYCAQISATYSASVCNSRAKCEHYFVEENLDDGTTREWESEIAAHVVHDMIDVADSDEE